MKAFGVCEVPVILCDSVLAENGCSLEQFLDFMELPYLQGVNQVAVGYQIVRLWTSVQ